MVGRQARRYGRKPYWAGNGMQLISNPLGWDQWTDGWVDPKHQSVTVLWESPITYLATYVVKYLPPLQINQRINVITCKETTTHHMTNHAENTQDATYAIPKVISPMENN